MESLIFSWGGCLAPIKNQSMLGNFLSPCLTISRWIFFLRHVTLNLASTLKSVQNNKKMCFVVCATGSTEVVW